MKTNRRTFAAIMVAAGMTMLPSLPIAAQDAVSFEGQTVEWVIPYGEGGGNDAWARFFAPYLSKHLPGEPNVIVRNVPGGGGLSGANQFAQRPVTDGTAVLGMSGSNQFPYLLGDSRVLYDYRDFTPVLASPTGGVVYISAEQGITDPADLAQLRDVELVFANTGATSLDLVLMLGFDMLGLDVRHVFGMTSRGETRIAFERGEATIDYQTSSAYLANVAPMVEEGTVVPLFSLGALDAQGNLVRDPTFPEIPHLLEVYEMVNGEAPEAGDQLEAYMAFFSAGFPAQKMVLIANDTPAEIVETYREAFAAAVADPELQAQKDAILGDYEQAVGDAADRLFEIATTISPGAKQWMLDYLRTEHDVEI